MLFATHEFALFLLAVFLLCSTERLGAVGRKLVLLLASVFFYACWDLRFTGLLLFSVALNYAGGLLVGNAADPRARRRWVVLAVGANLAVLGFFKYQGFFADSLQSLLQALGWRVRLRVLEMALPVGLSFYTFRAISYIVDVYRRDMEPCRSLLDWAVCLTFFPYLVAGPISRPREFLPQLADHDLRRGIPAGLALAMFLGGLVKKIVIANYLQTGLVDPVFEDPHAFARWQVWLATYGYAVQIYCDFSAYSDMAIGVALLLGFQSPQNFDAPYRAASLQEFWRRWHMSLSTWLRDYLYIPLGGSRCSAVRTQVNLLLTMLLGGLWHGAAWHYVVWGALHGGGLALERRWLLPRRAGGDAPWWALWWRRCATFHFVCLTWVFFRAESFSGALDHLRCALLPHGQPATSSAVTPALVVLLGLGMVLHFLPMAPVARCRERLLRQPVLVQALALGLAVALLRAAWPDGVAPFIYAGF